MPKKRYRRKEHSKSAELSPSIICSILVSVGLIYFYKILTPNVLIYATDQITAGYAIRLFHSEVLKEFHKIPLWDPYLFSGIPFVDAFHGDIFYPLSFLRIMLPTHVVLNWYFIIHTILAGIFMFLFLLEIKIEKIYAFVFSLSYMFSGSIVSLVYPGHDAKVAIAAFTPLVFMLIHRGVREEDIKWFFIASIPLGFGLLAPHVQMMYYLYMASFIYFLYEVYLKLNERNIKTVAKLSLYFISTVVLSLLIGAIQLFPAYEYVVKYSPRSAAQRGYEFAVTWSLPWEDYISSFFAKFSGFIDSYWGRNPFKINTEYVGDIPFLFSIFAFLKWKHKKEILIFIILFVFFSIMALGGFTPFYRIFYYLLPGVKKFRASAMSFYIVAFSINTLGALGISILNSNKRYFTAYYKKIGIFTAVVFVFAILSIPLKDFTISLIKTFFINSGEKLKVLRSNYNQIPLSLFRFAIIFSIGLYLHNRGYLSKLGGIFIVSFIVIADLWSINWNFLKTLPSPDVFYRKDEVIKYLEKDKDVYRVFPLFYRIDENYLMIYGIESIGGHHGNQFQRYQEYLGNPEHFMFRPNGVPDLLKYPYLVDLLNVKYVITQPIPKDLSPYKNNPEIYSLLTDVNNFLDSTHFRLEKLVTDGKLTYAIYRNLNFIPRVLFVDSIEILTKEEVLNRLKSGNFEPLHVALLEESPDFVLERKENGAKAVFRFVEKKPDYVKLEVEVDSPVFMIYLENYYPKFKAYLDGKEVKCYRTNYIFRGLYIGEEGKHIVEFKFDSMEYNILGTVSIVAILFIIVFVSFRRKSLF
jgi:hypothetical protein